jgi:hypothetical protein
MFTDYIESLVSLFNKYIYIISNVGWSSFATTKGFWALWAQQVLTLRSFCNEI